MTFDPTDTTRPLFKTTLSINNLTTIEYDDMLAQLAKLVLENVPEGTLAAGKMELSRIDFLIGRFANLYAFLMHLWAYASERSASFKRESQSAEYGQMVKKKETLYELAQAVKLKWEACSRMVTIALRDEDKIPDRVNYQAREEPKTPAQYKTPPPVNKPITKPSSGGWGSV